MQFSTTTCFIIGMFTCFSRSKGRAISRCTDPINATDLFIDINSGFNKTHYLLEGIAIQDSGEDVNDIAYTNVYGMNKAVCPNTVPRGDYPLRVRSTCPWYIRVDYDSTRIPSALPKAVSSCAFCVGSNGTQKCEPIHQNIKVLRQTYDCGNGLYEYEAEKIRIIIAYTCAVPKEQESSANYPSNRIISEADPIPIA